MAVKKKYPINGACVFDKTIKITREKNDTIMLVAYEPHQAPVGDVYCFTTADDLIEFLGEQAFILNEREQ